MNPEADELALLIERCAGVEAEDADWQRLHVLAADPAKRLHIQAELRLALRLHGLLRAPDPTLGDRVLNLVAAQRTTRRHRTLGAVERRLRRRRTQHWWPLALAALLLCGVGLVWLGNVSGNVSGADVPRCFFAAHAVALGDGAVIPKTGTLLPAGMQLSVRTGDVALRWSDSTDMQLTTGSTITIEDPAQGKHLLFQRGSVEATVAKQPAGRPLIIRTPLALVQVVGTQFILTSEADQTHLHVIHGQVKIAAVSGGEALLVSPERDAEVSLTGPARWSDPITTSNIAPTTTLRRVAADADGSAQKFEPDRIDGQSIILDVKRDAPSNHELTREVFLRFPVAALRGQAQHTWLLLHVTEDEDPTQLTVAQMEGNFTEDSLCWNNRPTHGQELATWIADKAGPLRVDLGAVLASGDGDLVLRIASPDIGRSKLGHFAAREHPNADWRPALELELRPDKARAIDSNVADPAAAPIP